MKVTPTLHVSTESFGSRKKERGIQWEDCTLSIYEDMTKERSGLRGRFSPIMKALWDHQVNMLAHLTILRFALNGERLSFTDQNKAEIYVWENINSTEKMTIEPKALYTITFVLKAVFFKLLLFYAIHDLVLGQWF